MAGSQPPRKRDRMPSFDSAYVLIRPPESAHTARMAQPHTDKLPFKQFAKPRTRNNSGVLGNRAKRACKTTPGKSCCRKTDLDAPDDEESALIRALVT